jgi:DNA polymerase (family 10)
MIERARKEVKGIGILAGVEVDILEDGSLYLSDKTLAKLDWVVASVHGNFKLSRDVMTKRLIKGLSNPHVNVFAHPTSRLLLKRDPIEYDIDKIFKLCAEKHVALEINASIFRLDLNDVLARKAKEAGCSLVIDSDAHHPREFDYRFGITQARRGWIEKKDVINTRSFADVEKWMQQK